MFDGHYRGREGGRRLEYDIALRSRTLLAISVTVALGLLVYGAWKYGLISHLSDHEQLVKTLRSEGGLGPLVCIGVQFLQVVMFPVPGEITQIAAGYVFGAWLGFLYSVVGIMLGSAFDYSFARLVGRPLVERLLGRKRLERVDSAFESRKGKSALFVLFLIPGMPKDAMSYGAGLTQLRLGEFVVISGLARTPALLFSTLIGSQLYDRDFGTMAVTGVIGLLAIAGFYVYQKRYGTP